MLDDKEQIKLEYQDDGKGIAQECIAGVFEPFYTTSRSEGSGLGLYICYNIVSNDLKGRISCNSQLGKGAEFTVVFPMEAQTA
ncbi:MAG: ATP-binding protein [Motiliproteus sp.]